MMACSRFSAGRHGEVARDVRQSVSQRPVRHRQVEHRRRRRHRRRTRAGLPTSLGSGTFAMKNTVVRRNVD